MGKEDRIDSAERSVQRSESHRDTQDPSWSLVGLGGTGCGGGGGNSQKSQLLEEGSVLNDSGRSRDKKKDLGSEVAKKKRASDGGRWSQVGSRRLEPGRGTWTAGRRARPEPA